MRGTLVLLGLVVGCGGGGNDVDPRVIAGGGIGDGAIDGELNVHVIDEDDEPVADATVQVGTVEQTTDADGLAVFTDVAGPQTIAVRADGFRQVAWVGANGANVSIPVVPLDVAAPASADLSGSITGWDTISVAQNHIKAAIVLYSQSDALGDAANSIPTAGNTNICGIASATCDFTVTTRTGTVTVIAAIIDRDTKGTADETDDTTEIIGWATRPSLTVEDGVDQSGLTLEIVEAGNLENVTIDLGAPPAGLPEVNAVVGVEVGADEVVQLPGFLATDPETLLAPKPTVFDAAATYRLTAIAQTTSGGLGPQSILLRRGLTGTTLAAGDWLVPPTGLDVTRDGFTFEPIDGATVHQVSYLDAPDHVVAEITMFDATTAADLPPGIELPSGALTAKVSGIGADLDVTNFSLEEDADRLFGIAAQPTTVE